MQYRQSTQLDSTYIFCLSIPVLARLDHQGVGKSEDIGQHGANARKHVLRNPL